MLCQYCFLLRNTGFQRLGFQRLENTLDQGLSSDRATGQVLIIKSIFFHSLFRYLTTSLKYFFECLQALGERRDFCGQGNNNDKKFIHAIGLVKTRALAFGHPWQTGYDHQCVS